MRKLLQLGLVALACIGFLALVYIAVGVTLYALHIGVSYPTPDTWTRIIT